MTKRDFLAFYRKYTEVWVSEQNRPGYKGAEKRSFSDSMKSCIHYDRQMMDPRAGRI